MRTPVKYAKSGNVRIAYQITGQGSIDMVYAPGTVSHLDLDWEWPQRAEFINGLGSFCRLVRFDKRGTGLSDRPVQAATLEERTDDIRAVMDASGSTQAVIYGASEGGSMAILFAATYPQRTRALILWGVQARWIKTDDYPWGLSSEENQRQIERLAEEGITLEYLMGSGAGLRDADPAYLEWFIRYGRAGGSPSAVSALERMNAEIDVRNVLATIHVPTLVMNRTGDPVANVEAARDLASKISGAKFVELPGNTHAYSGIHDLILKHVEEFVTGTHSHASFDRVLATILFVDIVRSTEMLANMGDRRWMEVLDGHNEIVRRNLAVFRGQEVKTTGDGFIATFDGPTRAIECARAIRDSVRRLGIEVRAGLHTGECELMGSDVGGIAVHMAARVAAAAGPSQVLISDTVKGLVAGSGIRLEDHGIHSLKGIPGKSQLFLVV